MEIAVISDVHSNLPALKAVLDEIGGMKIFCCGDITGYNPFPNETIEMFRKRGVRAVLGNHDYAVINRDTSRLNSYAAKAAGWTMDVITKENLRFLRSLSEEFRSRDFTAFHGSPKDPFYEYVYEDASESVFESFLGDAGILILGHTHMPFVKPLERGIVLNPGSVGQPRDGDPRASYAVLDVERKDAEIRRAEYDIDSVAEKIIENGLPAKLAKRLYKGI